MISIEYISNGYSAAVARYIRGLRNSLQSRCYGLPMLAVCEEKKNEVKLYFVWLLAKFTRSRNLLKGLFLTHEKYRRHNLAMKRGMVHELSLTHLVPYRAHNSVVVSKRRVRMYIRAAFVPWPDSMCISFSQSTNHMCLMRNYIRLVSLPA